LFEITEGIERILAECVDMDTGEISDEASHRLDVLHADRDAKLLNCALYREGELCEAKAVADVIEKLTKRKRTHESRARWLLGYMETHAPDDSRWEIRDPRIGRIGYAKSERVEEEIPGNLDGVDPEYVRTKTERSVDKAAARKVLKAGGKVRGLVLRTVRRLAIR
jgi:hypothetical protein